MGIAATLRLISTAVAYTDVGETDNPTKRNFDWSTDRSYPVSNAKSFPYTVDPGATYTLFSNSRATTADGTTQYTLTLSTLAATRYRFTWTAGTNPTLRTARALALNTRTVTVTANANLTVTMATQAGDWTAVQAGDTVFIPDTTTGDSASPFNIMNVGYWTVLAVAGDGSSVTLARPTGTGFIGYSESVPITANTQVVAYSAAGVQVGDTVDVNAGFTGNVLQTYSVVAVTSTWFEIVSTLPLPSGVAALPGASGVQFYNVAKRWVRIEADQLCVARFNGDTGNTNKIAPWAPADQDNVGYQEKTGPVYSLVVVNLSNAPLNLTYWSVE